MKWNIESILTWFTSSRGEWSIAIGCLADSRGWRRHSGWGGPGLGFHIRRWIWHCSKLLHSAICDMKGEKTQRKQSSGWSSSLKTIIKLSMWRLLAKQESAESFTWAPSSFLKPKTPQRKQPQQIVAFTGIASKLALCLSCGDSWVWETYSNTCSLTQLLLTESPLLFPLSFTHTHSMKLWHPNQCPSTVTSNH